MNVFLFIAGWMSQFAGEGGRVMMMTRRISGTLRSLRSFTWKKDDRKQLALLHQEQGRLAT